MNNRSELEKKEILKCLLPEDIKSVKSQYM